MLAALSDPEDPEGEEYREWLGGKLDPEAFSLARRNREVQRLRLVPRHLIDVPSPRAWQW